MTTQQIIYEHVKNGMIKDTQINLPFWLESATARRTPCAWIVDLRARTHDVGCGKALSFARIRLPLHPERKTERNAICWATGTPTAKRLRTTARGCWIMKQLKDKWDAATRHDLLGGLAQHLRAKYDGISYLYESEEAQDELIKVLKLSDLFTMNYPVGLVPKPEVICLHDKPSLHCFKPFCAEGH